MTAKIYYYPMTGKRKTSKTHRSWSESEKKKLRKEYEAVKGKVPEGWYDKQAEKYQRTKTAIKKQLHNTAPKEPPRKTQIITHAAFTDTPLKMAQNTLIGRWKEQDGNYWIRLYGQWNPVGLHEFIRAANVIRKARGELLIEGCGKWEP